MIHSKVSFQSLVLVEKVVPPLRMVDGVLVRAKIVEFSGITNGIVIKIMIPIMKGILMTIFLVWRILLFFEKNSSIKTHKPRDERIIIDSDANTSSLTNAELM